MKKIFVMISLMILAGCSLFERDNKGYWLNNVRSYKTYPINYYTYDEKDDAEKLIDSKTLNANTYQRNVLVSAKLGQRMVDSQTYTVKNYGKDKMVASANGEVYNINNTVKITKDTEFKPIGEVKIHGKYYLLVDPREDNSILLVDEKGHFTDNICQIYNGELLVSRYPANVAPKGLGIVKKKDVRKESDEPKLQFEIKYDGVERDTMSFIYVDYSNSNSTEGYFQRFVFPVEQEVLDINGVKIKVMDAYPDTIEYMLLND